MRERASINPALFGAGGALAQLPEPDPQKLADFAAEHGIILSDSADGTLQLTYRYGCKLHSVSAQVLTRIMKLLPLSPTIAVLDFGMRSHARGSTEAHILADDGVFNALCEALPACVMLHTLSVDSLALGGSRLQLFGNAIGECCMLRKLDLSCVEFTTDEASKEGVHALAAGLAKCTGMLDIIFSEATIDSDRLLVLAPALPKSLTAFDLGFSEQSHISEDAWTVLGAAVSHMKELTNLSLHNLEGASKTPSGAAHVFSNCCLKLTQLDLCLRGVGISDVEVIAAKLPQTVTDLDLTPSTVPEKGAWRSLRKGLARCSGEPFWHWHSTTVVFCSKLFSKFSAHLACFSVTALCRTEKLKN
eukprot:COSAG01_NODE_952_length_12499_cov_84.157661_8_plen_361_part_00